MNVADKVLLLQQRAFRSYKTSRSFFLSFSFPLLQLLLLLVLCFTEGSPLANNCNYKLSECVTILKMCNVESRCTILYSY